MKKIIASILVALSLVWVVACTPTPEDTHTDNKSNTPSSNTDVLTTSQKKAIAEKAALNKIYDILTIRYKQYDANATRYKIGAITNNYNTYTVNGTLYLYNKYGNLEDSMTFSIEVYVSDNGSYEVRHWDI